MLGGMVLGIFSFKTKICPASLTNMGYYNWFNPATFLCPSQDRTRISNIICHGLFFVFSEFSKDEK
jgi:hypothetical protein